MVTYARGGEGYPPPPPPIGGFSRSERDADPRASCSSFCLSIRALSSEPDHFGYPELVPIGGFLSGLTLSSIGRLPQLPQGLVLLPPGAVPRPTHRFVACFPRKARGCSPDAPGTRQ